MKWDYEQQDFSAGEISPRAQGHFREEFYKRGLGLLANVAPTRSGSVASRAGGKWICDPPAAGTTGAGIPPVGGTISEERGVPVQHIPVHDGPYGDFMVEVSAGGYVRLLDRKDRVLSWHAPIYDFTLDGFASAISAGWSAPAGPAYTDVWGDKKSKTIYLNNASGVGQRNISTAFIRNFEGTATPTGTDGSWNFRCRLAGDSVTLRVTLITGETQDFVLTRGDCTVNFAPRRFVGDDNQFKLSLLGVNGAIAVSTVWDMTLAKTGEQTSFGLLTVGGDDRIRATAFWTNAEFWVVMVGPSILPCALHWKAPADLTHRNPAWDFIAPLQYLPSPPDFGVGTTVVACAAYQNRLVFGLNDEFGTVLMSEVGYGSVDPTDSKFKFNFVTKKGTTTPIVAGAGQTVFPFTTKTESADLITFEKNGSEVQYDSVALGANQDSAPGGSITKVFAPPLAGGETITITIAPVPLATDPLSLELASPTGRVVWLNVLHGLVLGSTRAEKTFTQNASLSLDPATGADFDILDHSALGSDEALPALNVNEKLMFLQRGRQLLRSASVRFMWESGLPQNGLIAEDVGVLGEHLLKLKVRSWCYLKAPVPRLVFGFDDGTAAVATLDPKMGLAFSRLTIPACFGGIYSVASLDARDSSELWVGTTTGITLAWETFESDISIKKLQAPNALLVAGALAPYDAETPLPPVMDGWNRVVQFRAGNDLGLNGVNGGAGVTGNPAVSAAVVGQQAYLLFAGQVFGPFAVYDAGGGSWRLQGAWTALAAAGFTDSFRWKDATGAWRAGECYVGLAYPAHRATTLPLEGGNPRGTSQAFKSRKPQLYVRFVDSYVPKVNGNRAPEMDGQTTLDLLAKRWTVDLRFTELGFTRGAVVDVVMEVPLRMEFSAMFGGAQTTSV